MKFNIIKSALLCLFYLGINTAQVNFQLDFEKGLQYLKEGDINKARMHFEEELVKIATNWGKENKFYASCLNFLGKTYQLNHDITTAETKYYQALKIYENLDSDFDEYMDLIFNISQIHLSLGRYEEAKVLLEKLVRNIDENSENKIYAVRLLGNVLREMGDVKSADSLLVNEQISSTFKNPLNKINYLTGEALKYYTKGDYDSAINKYLEAAFVVEDNYSKHYPIYANIKNNLASIYKIQYRYDEAKAIYDEALELKGSVSKNNPSYSITLSNLAKLYVEMNDFDEAEKYYLELIENLKDQLKIYFPTLSEKEQADFWWNFQRYFDDFTTFVSYRRNKNENILADLLNFRITTKALLIKTTQMIKYSIRSNRSSLLTQKYNRLKKIREELSSLYSSEKELNKVKSARIDSLRKKYNAIDKELIKLSAENFDEFINAKSRNFSDVVSSLDKEEAAIEIIRYIDQNSNINYAAIIINGQDKDHIKFIEISDGDKLESSYLKNYQRRIKSKTLDNLSFKFYWEKINNQLNNIKTLYVSPDGVFNQINIASFLISPDKYLINKMRVNYVSNLSDIVKLKMIRKRDVLSNAVLVGAPSFLVDNQEKEKNKITSNKKSINIIDNSYFNFNVDELPGTRIEIEKIRNILQSQGLEIRKYIGEAANKKNVKLINSPSILHIATHGFFLKSKNSTLETGKNLNKYYEDNPLLRSGLLLSGVNNKYKSVLDESLGNGVLTAYETKEMNLEETQLVVLSACETGRGEIHVGEGVYGLQRAFHIAGAKSILMSLWQVDDAVTQKLMVKFYENLFHYESINEAFFYAQNEIKTEYPLPYYWAAFILTSSL